MTTAEMMTLVDLERRIESVEALIPVKFPHAQIVQIERFHNAMNVETTAEKLSVVNDWLEWLVAL